MSKFTAAENLFFSPVQHELLTPLLSGILPPESFTTCKSQFFGRFEIGWKRNRRHRTAWLRSPTFNLSFFQRWSSVAMVGEKSSLGSALWIQKIQPFSSSGSHVGHQYAELLQSGRHATCVHLWRLGSSKNSMGSRVDMEPVHQKFQHESAESARFSNATDFGQQAKHQGHMT